MKAYENKSQMLSIQFDEEEKSARPDTVPDLAPAYNMNGTKGSAVAKKNGAVWRKRRIEERNFIFDDNEDLNDNAQAEYEEDEVSGESSGSAFLG